MNTWPGKQRLKIHRLQLYDLNYGAIQIILLIYIYILLLTYFISSNPVLSFNCADCANYLDSVLLEVAVWCIGHIKK